MSTEYIGYIKRTKNDKFRGVIGTLHDVGEPDNDRVVHTAFESELFSDINDLISELTKICKDNDITKLYTAPITQGQILWESEFK